MWKMLGPQAYADVRPRHPIYSVRGTKLIRGADALSVNQHTIRVDAAVPAPIRRHNTSGTKCFNREKIWRSGTDRFPSGTEVRDFMQDVRVICSQAASRRIFPVFSVREAYVYRPAQSMGADILGNKFAASRYLMEITTDFETALEEQNTIRTAGTPMEENLLPGKTYPFPQYKGKKRFAMKAYGNQYPQDLH